LAGAKDDGGTREDDQGKKEGRAMAYAVHMDTEGLRAWDSTNEAISKAMGMQEKTRRVLIGACNSARCQVYGTACRGDACVTGPGRT
jgi:hypothetical protein